MDFSNVKKITIAAGDVKQIEIDGVVVWKSGHTNLVPTSIDTDGSIYNGCGYVDGYRLSSSGALKAQDNTVTTGFIKATQNDVIRMAGTKWDKTPGYNYIVLYDANFNLLETINRNAAGEGYVSTHGWSFLGKGRVDKNKTTVTIENDIAIFNIGLLSGYEYTYVRISAYGKGEDMVITVNEEIELDD